jgi:hypothetical protein
VADAVFENYLSFMNDAECLGRGSADVVDFVDCGDGSLQPFQRARGLGHTRGLFLGINNAKAGVSIEKGLSWGRAVLRDINN